MEGFWARLLRNNTKVIGIVALLVVLWIFMSIVVPESFLKPNNIENLLRRTAMYGILAIGVAFVIITSGIDLSIGSIVCLTGCLLAIFLRVDYQPFDAARVVQVRAADKQIWLPESGGDFRPGDRVRYYGGRRAHTAILRVVDVVPAQAVEVEGRRRQVTILNVDQPLSADDTYGYVAKVYEVVDFDAGSLPDRLPVVTIAGMHDELAPRDQLMLVHPQSGLKQLKITKVERGDGRTRIWLSQDLGTNFSLEWLAVPIERRQRMPILAAVALVLAIAAALGWLHGLLITALELPSFVVTLCGLLIYRGVSRWLVNDQVQGFGDEYERNLSLLASGKLTLFYDSSGQAFGIPYPFFIFVGTAIVAAIFLNKTIWGRYMLAVGRNEEAARYSGIDTARVTMVAYVICTVAAALGGMLFALDSNSVSPSSFGNFFELYAIAAAVLGGCSLRGGEGGIFGVVVGTAVMQTLYNLIVLLKISDKLEFAIIGLVILMGVIADVLIKRLMARRRAARESAAEQASES